MSKNFKNKLNSTYKTGKKKKKETAKRTKILSKREVKNIVINRHLALTQPMLKYISFFTAKFTIIELWSCYWYSYCQLFANWFYWIFFLLNVWSSLTLSVITTLGTTLEAIVANWVLYSISTFLYRIVAHVTRTFTLRFPIKAANSPS